MIIGISKCESSRQATVICKYLTEELQKEGVIVAKHSNVKSETAVQSGSAKAMFNLAAKSRIGQADKTFLSLKKEMSALAQWLSWLEHCPIHQKVAGSIPSQGTFLGCRSDPWSGHIGEATDQCFSLFLPLLSFLSKNQ